VDTLSGEQLEQRYEAAQAGPEVVRFYYAGTAGDRHHIVEQRWGEQVWHQVPADELVVPTQMRLTRDPLAWVDLYPDRESVRRVDLRGGDFYRPVEPPVVRPPAGDGYVPPTLGEGWPSGEPEAQTPSGETERVEGVPLPDDLPEPPPAEITPPR
jgi:hypothetical protein